MPMVLWTNFFTKAQGYEVKENIGYQDNKREMLLTKNWESSSRKRTKHINVKYFCDREAVKGGYQHGILT